MKLIFIITLLGLSGCASKPVVVKDCVKADGSNVFVCKKL